MMINLSLLARMHALTDAFNQDGFKDMVMSAPLKTSVSPNFKDLSLKDLVKKEDEDEDGKGEAGGDESGGGTMKGLRGKHDAHAKAVNAMRRLGR